MPSFDSFGFNGETSNGDGKPTEDITDLDTGKTGQLDADGNPIDDITSGSNGNGGSKTNANKDDQSSSSTGGQPTGKANDADAEHGLEEGTIIEDGVKECIDKRQIAGYRIPETVIIERNGKQISTTPEDFFNYVYQVDDKGLSRYENDLMKLSSAERRDEELLKAWLKYTGKGYDSLIEMAVSDKEAKKLKLTASQRKSTKGAIKITKPDSKKDALKDERFGY